jgi:hypothetical protein
MGRPTSGLFSWKNQVVRRLDSGLLKETKPEVYQMFLKETSSRVLRVKETK